MLRPHRPTTGYRGKDDPQDHQAQGQGRGKACPWTTCRRDQRRRLRGHGLTHCRPQKASRACPGGSRRARMPRDYRHGYTPCRVAGRPWGRPRLTDCIWPPSSQRSPGPHRVRWRRCRDRCCCTSGRTCCWPSGHHLRTPLPRHRHGYRRPVCPLHASGVRRCREPYLQRPSDRSRRGPGRRPEK